MKNDTLSKSRLIFEYICSILKKYDALSKETNKWESLRVVDVQYNQWNECCLKIQIIGKATIFNCCPKEIAEDDKVLEKFSKKDIRTIIYLATEEMKKPKYKLMVQDVQKNEMVFKLSKYGSPQSIEKTAQQISLDKKLLSQLSQEDAHIIGYTVGTEQILIEKQEIEQLKNNSNFS